ncbi:hypothetical protein BC629DRAFT_1599613 [Irpex lacteus]|nr:hypothetical protein BC629DRAFT_1599613 [Irpex lacteus]
MGQPDRPVRSNMEYSKPATNDEHRGNDCATLLCAKNMGTGPHNAGYSLGIDGFNCDVIAMDLWVGNCGILNRILAPFTLSVSMATNISIMLSLIFLLRRDKPQLPSSRAGHIMKMLTFYTVQAGALIVVVDAAVIALNVYVHVARVGFTYIGVFAMQGNSTDQWWPLAPRSTVSTSRTSPQHCFIGAINAKSGKDNTVDDHFTGCVSANYYYSWDQVGHKRYTAMGRPGESSSREHAALHPRSWVSCYPHASFTHIRDTNLEEQGMLALTFVDPIDSTDKVDGKLGIESCTLDRNFLMLVLRHTDGTQEAGHSHKTRFNEEC